MTSRLRLRRALIELNHPKHQRTVEWVHESSRFKNRVTRTVRTSQRHIKRRKYNAARKPKQPYVWVKLLTAAGVVCTAAEVLYHLASKTLN